MHAAVLGTANNYSLHVFMFMLPLSCCEEPDLGYNNIVVCDLSKKTTLVLSLENCGVNIRKKIKLISSSNTFAYTWTAANVVCWPAMTAVFPSFVGTAATIVFRSRTRPVSTSSTCSVFTATSALPSRITSTLVLTTAISSPIVYSAACGSGVCVKNSIIVPHTIIFMVSCRLQYKMSITLQSPSVIITRTTVEEPAAEERREKQAEEAEGAVNGALVLGAPLPPVVLRRRRG